MSYLQDRKVKQKRLTIILVIIFVFFIMVVFRTPLFRALSLGGQKVFKPVWVLGGNIGTRFSMFFSSFASKQSLLQENDDLKMKLNEALIKNANQDVLLDENTKLKEILGRKGGGEFILGNILAKPNQSLYDTLIIDIGEDHGVVLGNTVFALGNVPIGHVAEVFKTSSKVTLYSSWKEKTEVALSGSDVFMNVVGRGGGNFEMLLPRDFEVENGQEVVLSGSGAHVVGRVVTVISDPRDSYKKALLVAPVNIQQLKFVQVRK